MARTKDPHAATLKAWETRRRNAREAGDYGPEVAAMPLLKGVKGIPLVVVDREASAKGKREGKLLPEWQRLDGQRAAKAIESEIAAFEIPAMAIDGLDLVEILPTNEMDEEEVLGLYETVSPGLDIQISSGNVRGPLYAGDPDGATGLAEVLAHEIGHHVHLSKITDATLTEWADLSMMGKNAKVSSYARTNVTEHFAEAFQHYADMKDGGAWGRELLELTEPAAFDFMKRLFSTPSMWKPEGEVEYKSHTEPFVMGEKWMESTRDGEWGHPSFTNAVDED